MDCFEEIQNLISEDKIQKVDNLFYSRIKQRINELEKSQLFVFKIKKSHIFLSVAAGLLLGFFVGKIVQHQIWQNHRILMMENVLNNCHLDEIKLESKEFQILTDLYRKRRS